MLYCASGTGEGEEPQLSIISVLLGILAFFALLGIAAMVFLKLTIGRRDSWRRPEEKRKGTGERRALLLYQPSNGGHNIPQAEALAGLLAEEGYTVTVNYPSGQLDYDPGQYDLLAFGTPVYMGETAKPLHQYLESHPFTGKRVLLFVNGRDEKAPELEALKLRIGDGNQVFAVKVPPKDARKLLAFANEHI